MVNDAKVEVFINLMMCLFLVDPCPSLKTGTMAGLPYLFQLRIVACPASRRGEVILVVNVVKPHHRLIVMPCNIETS